MIAIRFCLWLYLALNLLQGAVGLVAGGFRYALMRFAAAAICAYLLYAFRKLTSWWPKGGRDA